MIEGLGTLLEGTKATGLCELRVLLAEVLGGEDVEGCLLEQIRLSRQRVFRLRFQLEGRVRSLIVKRLSPERALSERTAITRWLPRAGFGRHAVPLVGVASQRDGDSTWHVYEDLGGPTLRQAAHEPRNVRAAVEVIAAHHTRFVGHPLLAECRLIGVDLGTGFYATCVEDALRGLDAMLRLDSVHGERRELVQRLRQRLTRLWDERHERTRELVDLAWPETLQHGDLWATNVLVLLGESGPDVRLIDWDHAGVGPAVYDVSTLLRQFPRPERPWMLEAYRASVESAGWTWPAPAAWNRLAETAELARYANTIVWRTIVATQDHPAAPPDWIFEDLAETETWFDNLTPLLPTGDELMHQEYRPGDGMTTEAKAF